jgi:hypothetical protein
MHSAISFVAIIGLASHVIAAPSPYLNYSMISCVTPSPYRNQSGPSFVSAPSPVNQNDFPLPDGFPNPDESQLELIERQAFGTLPNASLPANVSMDSLTSLQLIAFNELFEVAYFTELLFNLTNSVEGYEISDSGRRDFIISNIIAVKNVCLRSL